MFFPLCWAHLAIWCAWLAFVFSHREASVLTSVRICPISNIYFPFKSTGYIMDVTVFNVGFEHLRNAIIITESISICLPVYSNLFHLCFYLILKVKVSLYYILRGLRNGAGKARSTKMYWILTVCHELNCIVAFPANTTSIATNNLFPLFFLVSARLSVRRLNSLSKFT